MVLGVWLRVFYVCFSGVRGFGRGSSFLFFICYVAVIRGLSVGGKRSR